MITTPQIYCQFLTNSHINYTNTYFAEHTETLSHDSINRFLAKSDLQPNLIWDKVKDLITWSPGGYLIFDDSVIDKNHSTKIETVYKQWSGNCHKVIRGIGLIGCIYYNPELKESWLLNFRIYDKADKKSKIDHVLDMIDEAEIKKIEYSTALFDAAYANEKLLNKCNYYNKYFVCNTKKNRKICIVDPELIGTKTYTKEYIELRTQNLESLEIGNQGVLVTFQNLRNQQVIKVFKSQVSTDRIDYLITNQLEIESLEEILIINKCRWVIEQFHREIKQITGIESCQCRRSNSQRNHICCSLLAWINFKNRYYNLGLTVYQQKERLLSDYLRKEMANPSIPFIW